MSAADERATAMPNAQQGQRDAKAMANLRARAALAGFELLELADGAFLISRWGRSKGLTDERAVEQFLQQVGAPA